MPTLADMGVTVAGTLSILLLARAARRCSGWMKRQREFTARMMECGELGPVPSDKAQRFWERLGRFFVFCFVGRIDALGQEKLASLKAPFVLAFNHSSSLDVAVAPVLLKRKARYPVDWRVSRALKGIVICCVGRCGAFSVDPDNGRPALASLIKVLSDGENVVIFPEALIHPDGSFWPFKTGTVCAARQASLNRGETVPIIPVYLRYGRYPGEWVNKHVIWAQGLVQFFIPLYRRGVRIKIGEAIDPLALPEDPRAATDILREKIFELDPARE